MTPMPSTELNWGPLGLLERLPWLWWVGDQTDQSQIEQVLGEFDTMHEADCSQGGLCWEETGFHGPLKYLDG